MLIFVSGHFRFSGHRCSTFSTRFCEREPNLSRRLNSIRLEEAYGGPPETPRSQALEIGSDQAEVAPEETDLTECEKAFSKNFNSKCWRLILRCKEPYFKSPATLPPNRSPSAICHQELSGERSPW